MLYLDVDLVVMAEPFHIVNAIRDNYGCLFSLRLVLRLQGIRDSDHQNITGILFLYD